MQSGHERGKPLEDEHRFNNRRLIGRASDRRSKMIAFGYYGGKFSHLDFLLPLLPTSFTHFCEPFGGSAAVLINRPPAPVETYNDLDSEVVNFFRCLRDHGDVLIRLISLTPFSREELLGVLSLIFRRSECLPLLVRARQTRTGISKRAGGPKHCIDLACLYGWGCITLVRQRRRPTSNRPAATTCPDRERPCNRSHSSL
jgi:DNA adenine methylase